MMMSYIDVGTVRRGRGLGYSFVKIVKPSQINMKRIINMVVLRKAKRNDEKFLNFFVCMSADDNWISF